MDADISSSQRWELYRVLSEPARLRLLALAAEEELSIGELAELLQESQPNVSRHAGALRQAGLLGDELPYSTAVDIDKFEMDRSLRRISATIYVDRESHKGIVIGEKGAQLKRIGTEARHAMQELFGSRVHLELWVKVKGGWADSEAALRQLGYK